jgi:hypothetical protein
MKNKDYRVLFESWQRFINEGESEYTELHMYDFDDTLFRSPYPPKWWYEDYDVYMMWDQDNPPVRSHEINEDWDTSPQSLGPPFMNKNPTLSSGLWKKDVLLSAIESQSKSYVYNMFCTGREVVLKDHIKEMMDNVNLTFDKDKYFLQPDDRDTAKFKVDKISKVLDDHPTIKKVCIWEDSTTNLTNIEELCNSRKDLKFEGYRIEKNPIEITMSKEEYLEKIKNI